MVRIERDEEEVKVPREPIIHLYSETFPRLRDRLKREGRTEGLDDWVPCRGYYGFMAQLLR